MEYRHGVVGDSGTKQYIIVKEFANGGAYCEHIGIDKSKHDYRLVKKVGIEFARLGEKVKANPVLHLKSKEYDIIYGALKGTKYYGKNPDLQVGNKFYEVESYIRPFKKDKISGMLSRGLKQSPNLIIDNNKGTSARFIMKIIFDRIRLKQNINEIWLFEKSKLTILYKKAEGEQSPPAMCKSVELPSNQI
ncbi:MAG: hypothetical protein LBE56_03710 [Tannerella sp.]|jgi:hypothetical protein|nr:hypothetical protein [Tannerella sp.]